LIDDGITPLGSGAQAEADGLFKFVIQTSFDNFWGNENQLESIT